jgi:hypothetical protein
MPGQSKCIKCGSILGNAKTVVEVYPPRMARWKKPFRFVARWMRRQRLSPEEAIRLRTPNWVRIVSKDAVLGLFLSIVPGLAQIIQKRFGQVRWHCVAWLALVLTGLFLYGGTVGFCLLGLAIGLHTWIAVHPLVKELSRFHWKLLVTVSVLMALVLIYRAVPGIALPGISGGHTSLTIPYHEVRRGDYLLARRSRASREFIRHGSLVLAHLRGRSARRSFAENAMIVEVIALPGETVEIDNDVFVIDGQVRDPEKYPVPEWLQGRELSVNIGDDRYFVSAEYTVYARGRQLASADIIAACVIGQNDIEAQAFVRWLPLSRRGFIKAIE